MAIKSFDEYFKENRPNFFQDMNLNNKVLANAKIVLEEFKTSNNTPQYVQPVKITDKIRQKY